ncbi:MAG: hypothetical protein HC905_19855 [Bacteroidales bacterium]|nr:hypothetical protein [Bacteroidales bacterium]
MENPNKNVQNIVSNDGKKVLSPQLGIVVHFQVNNIVHVENTIRDLSAIGINHIRTAVSWPDLKTSKGINWYNWLFNNLSRNFTILPCLSYTPSHILTENGEDFSKDIVEFISLYGNHFEFVEIIGDPYENSKQLQYNFIDNLGRASLRLHQLGKKIVLGNIHPQNLQWLTYLAKANVLQKIDVIGIQAYPYIFESGWNGWMAEISKMNHLAQKKTKAGEKSGLPKPVIQRLNMMIKIKYLDL